MSEANRKRLEHCNIWNYFYLAGCVTPNVVRALAVFAKSLPGDPTNRPWSEALRPIAPQTLEQARELIPPDRLANIALSLLYDQAPSQIGAYRVPRPTPNQRLYGLFSLALLGKMLGEFKQGQVCAEAADYGMSDYLDVTVLPDGGDLEQSFGYNWMLIAHAREYSLIYQDDAQKPAWLAKFNDAASRRAFMLAALAVPFGGEPKTGTSATSTPPEVWKDAKIWEAWKSQPVVHNQMLNAYDSRCEQIYRALWGKREKGLPPFTSVAFPYSGYYALRNSWDMDALYMFFIAAGRGGGHQCEMINSVQVAAYGRHMLVSSSPSHYGETNWFIPDQRPEYKAIEDYIGEESSWAHNTIILDGYSQRRHASFSTIAPKEPLPSRQHFSDNFDLVEGSYADGYGPHLWEGGRWAKAAATCRHERQVVFVRHPGFWIVIDRISDDGKPHSYSQIWNFPPRFKDERGALYAGFTPEQVIADEPARCVRTVDPEGPNVALRHFTTGPLVYTKLYGFKNPHRGWHSFGLSGEVPPAVDVWAHWVGRGEQLLVTLIYPSRDLTGEAKNVASLCSDEKGRKYGFRLELKDGSVVTFQTAQHQDELKIGALDMTGESLLLMERPDGQKRGLALGVSRLAVDGRAQELKATDFEFEIEAGAFKVAAEIKYPTPDKVFITPEGGMFVAPVKVEMYYAGPVGAQIRYTLDGSAPGTESLIYTGLVEITKSAAVSAQAFRGTRASGPAMTNQVFTVKTQ
jgi:hypothetical protein